MVQSATKTAISTIRIVIAEDHALVRQGTRRILEEQPDFEVVGEAQDGEAALHLIKRLDPDVAILDIRMPTLSGIDVVREINAVSPDSKILILSAYDDDEYILALMEAGVSGYLLKTAQANELVDAVRDVAQGKSVLYPEIAMKIARLWARRRTMAEQDASAGLSHREMEVLRLAAKGLSAKDIGNELGISVRTVNGHFDSIFNKFGVSSRIKAVLYALSRHIVTPEEDD